MKRDWDIIRRSMLMLEELGPGGHLEGHEVAPEDPQLGAYNLKLLVDSGLAKGVASVDNAGGIFALVFNLTWEGHELSDAIKKDTVWTAVKKTALEKGVDLTVKVVSDLSAKIVWQMLNG